jgi:hypothetical protein
MSLLKKLSSFFPPPSPRPSQNFYSLAVQCHRCGEIIHANINLNNDLSEYGEGEEEGSAAYHCRKLLIGKERCFQQIEVTLKFDARRNVVERQITGGKFVEG